MKCPCCGSEIAELPKIEIQAMNLTGMEERIVQSLIDRHPRGAKIEQLISDVYYFHDEPDFPETCVRVTLTRLRKKLAVKGWAIPGVKGGRGYNTTYRLEPLQ